MFGLGSTSQLGIGIAIRLYDQFSGTAARINGQLQQLQKNVGNSALNNAVNNYRNTAAGIAGSAALVSAGMYKMAQSGAQFQHTINMASIVGGGNRDKLKNWALQFSKDFINSPQEFAETMLANARAGVREGMDDIIKYQAAVATATGESLAGEDGVGAKILGILAGYGLKATEVIDYAGQKMTNFARVANGVTAAANATQASVFSIGESMEYMANTGQLAGVSLERALSMVGMLAQAKIHGSAAGTAISNAIDMLGAAASPLAGPKKLKALAMMGANPNVIRGMLNQGKGFEALEYVNQASNQLPRGDRLALLKEIFNRRGGRGIITAFMEGGDKDLASIRKDIEEGIKGDIAMKQANLAANDLQGDMKLLSNAFSRFKVAFTDAVGPTLRVILGGLTGVLKFVSAVLNNPIGKVLAGIIAVGAPIVAVLFGFRAAVLTATIALRGFGTTSSIGGFRGLLQGSLGMIGNARMGAAAGLIARNAAGRYAVAAGQTVNFAGKAYRGGQILPAAYLASMGIGSGAATAGGVASKLTGFLGKAGPWVSKGLGFFGKMLPVVGGVFLAVDVLKGIWGLLDKDKDKPPVVIDPIGKLYEQNLQDMYYANRERAFREGRLTPREQQMGLNQTVNLNLDGITAMSKNMQSMIAMQEARNVSNNVDFVMPDMGE